MSTSFTYMFPTPHGRKTPFLMLKKTVSLVLAVLFLVQPLSHTFATENEGNSNVKQTGFSASVNEFDGSLNYRYEIKVPPGRNGMQPNIVLSYSSANKGSTNDLFGQGWTISIPYIQRINRFGVEDLYGDDSYFSSFDGELVNIGGGNYAPRVETGNGLTYELSNNAWTVVDKKGNTYTFGSTTASRQDNASNTAEVYKWMIDTEEDSNGNQIDYTYYKDRGEIYPNSIVYNQNELFEIIFLRTARAAATSSYPDFEVFSGYEINEIQVEFDGDLVNKYELSKNEDRLVSITRTAYDGSNYIAYAPTLFTYADDGLSDTWSYASSWDTTLYNEFAPATRFVDVNGDALPDAVVSYFDTSWGPDHQRYVYLNNGNGWSNASGGYVVPDDEDAAFWNRDTGLPGFGQLVDVNSDGLADFVFFDEGSGGAATVKVYKNTGSGWTYDSSWDKSSYSDFARGTRFIDLNGDGLPEMVVSVVNESWGPDHQRHIYMNTGSGWNNSDGGFEIPDDEDFAFWDETGGRPGRGGLVDVNNDGLIDIYQINPVTTDYIEFYLNNGHGWDADYVWRKSIGSADFGPGIIFADVNGDGLQDYVQSWWSVYWGPDFQREVALNTGHSMSGSFTIPDNKDLAFWNDSDVEPGDGHISDVNGDGLADFISMGSDDEIKVYLNTSKNKTLISKIQTPLGGTSTYSYIPPGIQDSSNKNRYPFSVVEQEVKDAGFGVVATTTYAYEGGDFWFDSYYDKKFSGFATTTKENQVGNKVVHKFHQGNGSSTNEIGDDHYALIGALYEKDIIDHSDGLLKQERFNYFLSGTTSSSTSIYTESVLTRQYDGNSTPTDFAVGYTYDSYGNTLSKIEYGLVSGNSNGTFTDTGSDGRTYAYTYTSPLVGFVATEIIKDDSDNKVKESKYYYDSSVLGVASKGNLTKRQDWVLGTDYIETEWSYNSDGLVTSITDPLDNITGLSYDTYGLYVASSTDAEDHTKNYEYNYVYGLVATTTDENDEVYVTEYDPLGRLLEEKIPDPETGNLVLKNKYVYTDTPQNTSIKKIQYLDSSNSIDTYSYYDGFGKLVQERKENESSDYVVRDWIYDGNGLLLSESLPYYDSGSGVSEPIADDNLFTYYSYDALDRVVTNANAVGTTSTAYNKLTETVTDQLSNDKDYTYDVFGRLTTVTEYEGVYDYDTNYEWDENNNLTKVTDSLGNVRNISYDGLSRRTSLEDLHDISDSSYGIWVYDYDAVGNVSSTTDPNGQIINYTYDDVNRLLTEDYLGAAGAEAVYSYDVCNNGNGKLCGISNDSATTTYTYDHAGNIASETRTIAGTSYVTEYEYDWQGNQTLVTYPDDSEVRYSYNNGGQIEQVEQRESGGLFSDIISDFDYGPHGQITHQLFGNSVSSTRIYDEGELYRLRNIITSATSSAGTGGGGEEHALIEAELSLLTSQSTETTLDEEPILVADDTETAEQTEMPIEEGASEQSEENDIGSASTEAEAEDSIVDSSETVDDTESLPATEVQTSSPEVVTDPEPLETPASNDTQNTKKDTGSYEDTPTSYDLQLDKNNSAKGKIEVSKNNPEVRLEKWDGEAELTISYDDLSAAGEYDEQDKKIKWKGDKEEVHSYQLASGEGMEDGGFEIEIQLNEKPDTHKFVFSLDDYENLDFFYQPSLAKEKIEGETCSDTECVSDETGEITRTRPENVVGSYAVYHKEKQNYLEGDTDYAAGKVFHIYRPKITDANGEQVWGELDIKGDELTVAVPQDFLAQAAYPVIVDPTFGYTSTPGSQELIVSSDFSGSLYTSPSDYSSFDSLSFYCNTIISSYDAKAVIVEHSTLNIVSNGVSNPVTCSGTAGWKTPTFSSTPALSANTEYVLGIIPSASRVNLYYDSGATNQGHYDTSNSYSSPQDLGSISHYNKKHGIYVTYTASGGGNSAPSAPTSLEAEGQTNPTNITDNTPEFTAIYNDSDSGDSAVNYQIQVDDNSDFSSTYWDSTKTALTSVTEGSRTSDISYSGATLASSTTYYWRIKLWDDDDAEGAWSTVTATFSLAAGGGGGPTNATPTAPTLLETEGLTNPTDITDNTPEFTAIYNDPNSGDQAIYYQIQVATSTGFTSNVWDSTKTSLATTTAGNRTSDITYGGSALASSTTYYWRIKFWDDEDAEGVWSTATSTFSLVTPPPPPGPKFIQFLSYVYDAVGNITKIVDSSHTDSAATTTYTYDDLYRLESAATSQASTSPYSREYAYNSIGNITSFDGTSYSYTGHTGSSYANPHAVTDVAGDAYTYDNNGNLLTVENGPVNTWNYQNRLLTSAVNGATSTYGYDHTGQRVFKAVTVGTAGGGTGGEEFSDTFTVSSDTNLDSHTPETGGGYTHLINVGNCDIVIDSYNDELQASGSSCGSSDGGLYRTNSQATHADVELQVTAVHPDGVDDTSILACRIQDANNMYAVQFNEDSSQLYKRVSGTWTQLDTTNSQIADDSVVTLTCDGSSITFEDDGVEILGATDSSITSAGYGGIGMGAVIVAGNDVSTQSLDNFTMTTLGGGGGTETDTTTFFINNLYETTDTGTTTKHIYAGDMLVASIEGSGPGALTYYNHLDHLNSTRVTTDGIGATQTLTDYYPFGSLRIDEQYGDHDESRKFTGHELDRETNLTYAGARYLDSDVGRWTAQDPASRDNPVQFLRDPQQFNMYSYGRNNPLVLVDPTGEKVELFSRPINDPKIGKVGAHAFVSITASDPGSIGSIPGINTADAFTLGGYKTEGSQILQKAANWDLSYTGGGDNISSVEVFAPAGVSQANFERNIVSYYNSLPSEVDSYQFMGWPQITSDPNSNNLATSLLVGSGISQSQINSYQRQLFFDTHRFAPGLGVTYTTLSYQESAQAKLNSALNRLSTTLDKLSKSLKKHND